MAPAIPRNNSGEDNEDKNDKNGQRDLDDDDDAADYSNPPFVVMLIINVLRRLCDVLHVCHLKRVC